MTLTLTKGSISVTLTDVLSYYENDDKFIVQPGPNCMLTSHNGSGGMKNPNGTNLIDLETNQLNLPLPLNEKDSLVIVKPGFDRSSYWPVPGRSSVMEALGIVLVPYTATSGLLSPPAIGDGEITKVLRSEPIPESIVNLDLLPRVINTSALNINWNDWGCSEPTIEYLTNLLSPFGGELYDGWSTDTKTPDRQHPGYGSYYASIISQALVQLCSTKSNAEKRPLAIAIVNRGLDLIAAFSEGRIGFTNGGHCQGRKALIVTTGHLLDNRYFVDPTSIIGPRFQEDDCYTAREWWFKLWNSGWKFNSGNQEMDGSKLSLHPSSWGSPFSVNHTTFGWAFNSYLPQVVGCQIGTALGMYLMGRTLEMGVNHFNMVKQYMDGPPEDVNSTLISLGITIPWGTDYAVCKGLKFCSESWKRYSPVRL